MSVYADPSSTRAYWLSMTCAAALVYRREFDALEDADVEWMTPMPRATHRDVYAMAQSIRGEDVRWSVPGMGAWVFEEAKRRLGLPYQPLIQHQCRGHDVEEVGHRSEKR